MDNNTENNKKSLEWVESHTLSIVRDAFTKIGLICDKRKWDQPQLINVFSAVPTSRRFRFIYWLDAHLLKHLGLMIVGKDWIDDCMERYMRLLPMNYFRSLSSGILLYAMNQYAVFDQFYDMLEDQKSKDTFDWFLRFKICINITDLETAEKLFPYPTKSEAYYKMRSERLIQKNETTYSIYDYQIDTDYELLCHTWICKQYELADVCQVRQGDIVIDGGAYFGETAIWFADQIGKTGKVFSFEPSITTAKKLKQNIARNKLENVIRLVPYGLWNKNSKEKFLTQGYSSACSEQEGNCEIHVVTLDSFVEEQRLDQVDMIKLDIEGAELKALQGAAKTIQRDKPKLAICVYHKPEDLITIPFFIKSLVPEYKIYLAHKCITWSETIVFASV